MLRRKQLKEGRLAPFTMTADIDDLMHTFICQLETSETFLGIQNSLPRVAYLQTNCHIFFNEALCLKLYDQEMLGINGFQQNASISWISLVCGQHSFK